MAGGRPKKFANAKQLIELWQQFTDEISDGGFERVPTQTEFCRWLKKRYAEVDRRTIYNALNKYFPTIKSEFEQIQADTIAAGAMLGAYNPTMAIFGLKNWCKWTDKQQIEADVDTNIEVKFDGELVSFAK